MTIPLCQECYKAIHNSVMATETTSEYYQCCLCFGLLNPNIYEKVITLAKKEYAKSGHDGGVFVLAVNFPVSQLLRELMIQKIMGSKWVEMTMSPKSRLTYIMMAKFRQDGTFRPSLSGDLTMTLNFENDEFSQRDIDFFLCHKPQGFLNAGRKRRATEDSEIQALFTKVKVQTLVEEMSMDIIKSFTFNSPTKELNLELCFLRDPLYIAGRYQKFSRSLSQSPWTPDHDTPRIAGNSVSEKICDPIAAYFRCDGTKFTASGREDVDVRMLGRGRPFAVVLQNARRWAEMYNKESCEKTLKMIKNRINSESLDVEVGDLAIVTLKDTQMLNVGQEEKRKVYTALCHSYQKVTEEMARKLEFAMPVEISQLTPVRVLFRRPLIDRPRMIYSAKIQTLDDHCFNLTIETQAGTYVKEFVHGDFGRTNPSVGTLLGIDVFDGLSILELDVEAIDLEWPPNKEVLNKNLL